MSLARPTGTNGVTPRNIVPSGTFGTLLFKTNTLMPNGGVMSLNFSDRL